MFGELQPEHGRRRRRIVALSVAAHAVLLGWMLHTPDPQLLMPESTRLGKNGRVLAQIYWNTPEPDDSAASTAKKASEVYRHQRLAHQKLTLQKNSQLAKLTAPPLLSTPAEDKSKTQALSSGGHGAPAGLPYGAVGGPLYGNEIRPALPITMPDPVVYPWELPDSEGNVVVEITIDDRGEIVSKTVIQSMGQKLDQKMLAALENWHFHPATRNGMPIPSKQDAIYTFHARG